jgi:hypothetical protein
MVAHTEHHVQARRLVPSRTSDRPQRAQTMSGFRTQAAQMLYKVWDENGRSPVSGQGAWRIPQKDQPGKWMPPVRGDLVSGTRGYHLCRPKDLPNRLGPVIYEAEWRGERLDTPAGALVREARLVRRLPTWDQSTAWMFACDCAEHVLPLFEREHPYDDRPRQAIETVRRFLAGLATSDELSDARSTADMAVTEIRADVPWDAGLMAASAASNAASGNDGAAVWMAARAAARAPCWTDLWAEAWGARRPDLGTTLAEAWEVGSRRERAWQTRRLSLYLTGAVRLSGRVACKE